MSAMHGNRKIYPDGKKTCPDCGEHKPLSEFHTNSREQPLAYCKHCNNFRSAANAMRRKTDDELKNALRIAETRLAVVKKVMKERWL